jgi:16S rRNA (cytidine1402-2'-O)-methyltransferase
MSGQLYIVPTPIGNLEDITLRAIRILKEVDVILAEDTRTSSKLLQHYDIKKPLQAFHAHNEHKAVEFIIQNLLSGKNYALISDAGTPGISDPGFLMARECVKYGLKIETLPGATAFVPALVSSGFPCNEFVFIGFLPQKKGRQTALLKLKDESRTIILYESPYRVVKLLEELKLHLGINRQLCFSREISKLHEEHVRGNAEEILQHFKSKEPKGEFVVIISQIDEVKSHTKED